MSAVIIIIAFLVAGAIGYQFGPALVEYLIKLPEIFTVASFTDEVLFYIFNLISYVIPILLAVVLIIYNFIKKKFPQRVPILLMGIELFYLIYSIQYVYIFVLAIFEGENILDYVFVIVMVVVDIVFGILSAVIRKTKNDLIGLFYGLVFAGFFAYRMIDLNRYDNVMLYMFIAIGLLASIYSVLCFAQMKKIKKEEAEKEAEEQEVTPTSIEEEDDAIPTYDSNVVEHAPGYLEEPAEGEVLQDDEKVQ